ncbi:MAG TPA: hypothetical protein VN796_01900 [Acidimicrobiales bacterium]|nr:hypothetical protein [Acidimicrobiales bacterium]
MAGSSHVGYPAESVGKATAELTRIAAMIDSLSESSSPSMELLEAERTVHGALLALLALDTLGASLTDIPSAESPELVGIDRDSMRVSILYDDLVVPTMTVSVAPEGAVGHAQSPS